jgi:hypothetical protein
VEGASMMFHGDYKKRCLLTILVSQILLVTPLISEIKKSTTANSLFTTIRKLRGKSLLHWPQIEDFYDVKARRGGRRISGGHYNFFVLVLRRILHPGPNVTKLFTAVFNEFS